MDQAHGDPYMIVDYVLTRCIAHYVRADRHQLSKWMLRIFLAWLIRDCIAFSEIEVGEVPFSYATANRWSRTGCSGHLPYCAAASRYRLSEVGKLVSHSPLFKWHIEVYLLRVAHFLQAGSRNYTWKHNQLMYLPMQRSIIKFDII